MNQYYRSADAVVFVYDVTKISTFENISTWMDECSRHIDLENTTKAIIGNKLVNLLLLLMHRYCRLLK